MYLHLSSSLFINSFINSIWFHYLPDFFLPSFLPSHLPSISFLNFFCHAFPISCFPLVIPPPNLCCLSFYLRFHFILHFTLLYSFWFVWFLGWFACLYAYACSLDFWICNHPVLLLILFAQVPPMRFAGGTPHELYHKNEL